jgi:hypothetical protein
MGHTARSCQHIPELLSVDGIAVHNDGQNTQPMEEADICHGQVFGALLSDAAVGIVGDVHDLDLARLQMDGDEDRHKADDAFVNNQDLSEVDRCGGRRVMDDGSFII